MGLIAGRGTMKIITGQKSAAILLGKRKTRLVAFRLLFSIQTSV